MSTSVVDNAAPSIVRNTADLGRSETCIETILAACQELDLREFILKGKEVEHEAVQLETPMKSGNEHLAIKGVDDMGILYHKGSGFASFKPAAIRDLRIHKSSRYSPVPKL